MPSLRERFRKSPIAVSAYRYLQKNLGMQRAGDFLAHYFDARIRCKVTPFGFSLYGRGSAVNRRMMAGTYEVDDLREYQRLIRGHDVFVDIGGNIGYYTSHALALGKSVVCCEPQFSNLECLYRTLDANQWFDRCEVFPLGLAATPGITRLFGRSGGSASLIKGWDGYSSGYYQYIPLSTLDIVLGNRFAGRKVFIKIDVEGSELAVLHGARQVLDMSPRPTFLVEIGLHEFHPAGLNPDFEKIFSLFWNAGYQARLAHSSETVGAADVAAWIARRRTDHGQVDYVFAP